MIGYTRAYNQYNKKIFWALKMLLFVELEKKYLIGCVITIIYLDKIFR